MDPVSAIGLAAAISQFTVTMVHISKRICGYLEQGADLPESLRDLSRRLEMLDGCLRDLLAQLTNQPEQFSLPSLQALGAFIFALRQRCNGLQLLLDKL